MTLNVARERALEYRRLAESGLNPRFKSKQDIPTFEEVAHQVHINRRPTWKNAKHGQQFINTMRDCAFPKIGRMPVDSVGEPEVLMCLSPIWTENPQIAKRVAQRISIILNVAKSKGFRSGENPVTSIQEAGALPKVSHKKEHHPAMDWRDVPAFYADLKELPAMAAQALRFACLTGSRTGEVLGAKWGEFDFDERVWTVPAERMKTKSAPRPAHG